MTVKYHTILGKDIKSAKQAFEIFKEKYNFIGENDEFKQIKIPKGKTIESYLEENISETLGNFKFGILKIPKNRLPGLQKVLGQKGSNVSGYYLVYEEK